MFRPCAGRDENGGGVVNDICNVPYAWRIDRVITRTQRHRGASPIGKLLRQDHRPSGADDDLRTKGMHFPVRPVPGKGVLADQSPLDAISAVASAVFGVPFHPTEWRLRDGGRAQTQMDESIGKARRPGHAEGTMQNALSLFPSRSRK